MLGVAVLSVAEPSAPARCAQPSVAQASVAQGLVDAAGDSGAAPAADAAPTFSVADADLPDPLVVIAYGDMRFTDPNEQTASKPSVRRALVAKVAAEHPAAVFLNGDVPWHGIAADYAVYRTETKAWREAALRVYPALGNHEFAQCAQAQCLEEWWHNFPQLRDRRWYSVAVGSKILGIALDSDASLLSGSEQREWLERQMAVLAPRVEFVLIVLHHPPVADIQTGELADHNPRPNELALADYLSGVAKNSRVRILVSAGHIHNYERFERDGVIYLVSGGGGARPYPVVRTEQDLYDRYDFPNYHYVRLEIHGRRLTGEMIRLADPNGAKPGAWEVKDRFRLMVPPETH